MTSEPVLVANQLCKSYWQGDTEVAVLNHLNLEVAPGETVAVVGVSGSGKSTLLHVLAGLDQPDSGEVFLKGHALAQLGQTQLGRLRNQHLGFVYQFHHLLPEFSALENVAMPLMIGGTSKRQALAQAAVLLERVGLSHRSTHHPGALSGGERQRVAIARALVTTPAVVLADEPTGNLDEESAEQIHQLMMELATSLDVAFVVVTHNRDFARRMHTIYELKRGALQPAA